MSTVDKSKDLESLLMAARSALRQSVCPGCNRAGYRDETDCESCRERTALCEQLLSHPAPVETDGGIFDQYPQGTLFQKQANGNLVAMTPDGKTHSLRQEETSNRRTIHVTPEKASEQCPASNYNGDPCRLPAGHSGSHSI